MVAEMANIPRKQAKTINLGMMYGMGVNKLSEQLDVSVEEAKKLTKQYHDRVPFVKGLMTGVMNRLNEKSSGGSLHSLLGRKCRFDLWEPDTFAMNKAMPYKEAVDEVWAPRPRLKTRLHLQGAQSINPSICCGYDEKSYGGSIQARHRSHATNTR